MDYQQNFLASLAGGLQFGQDLKRQRDQTQLKGLASLAYGAPREQRQSQLAEMAKISPEFAQAQQKNWNAEDDRDQQELIGYARFIKNAPPEQQQAAYTNYVLPKLRARGMQAPDWTQDTQETILQTVDALTQWDADPSDTPSGYREFELLTNAAGYKPGSPEYKTAAGTRLGTVGRASSAGYSADTIDIGDGRKRPARFNPRTGTQEYYDESVGQWRQLGGPGDMGGGFGGGEGGGSGFSAGGGDTETRVNIEGISPEDQQRYANVMATMRAANFDDAAIAEWLDTQLQKRAAAQNAGQIPTSNANGPTYTPAGASPGNRAPNLRAPVGVGAGRTKEEEAAAVRDAEIRTDLNYAGQRATADADAAYQRKTAEARAQLEADIAATHSTRTRDAGTVVDLLGRAERLVQVSTGSGLGAKRDEWAAQFGGSTPGGEAIAALRVLSGQLVSKMPRMEGPQSDADRLMYQQMAGDLANPNIPVRQRLAALRTLRELQQKYAGPQAGSRGPQAAPRAGEVRKGYRFKGGDPNQRANWERI